MNTYGYGMMGGMMGAGYFAHPFWSTIFGLVVLADLVLLAIFLAKKIWGK